MAGDKKRVPPKTKGHVKAPVKRKKQTGEDVPPCDCECDDCGAFPNPCTDGVKYVKVWPCTEGVKGPCEWLDIDSIAARVVQSLKAQGLVRAA